MFVISANIHLCIEPNVTPDYYFRFDNSDAVTVTHFIGPFDEYENTIRKYYYFFDFLCP